MYEVRYSSHWLLLDYDVDVDSLRSFVDNWDNVVIAVAMVVNIYYETDDHMIIYILRNVVFPDRWNNYRHGDVWAFVVDVSCFLLGYEM